VERAEPLTVEVAKEAIEQLKVSKSTPAIRTRRLLNSLLNYLAGMRGGESGGEKRGVTAGGVSIGVSEGWCKFKMHRGTKTDEDAPHIYVSSVTASGFDMAAALMSHFEAWGMHMVTSTVLNPEAPSELGLTEEVMTVDHVAVHLPLVGVVSGTPAGDAYLGALQAALREFPSEAVRRVPVVEYLMKKARSKCTKTDITPDSRYLNVAVGREGEVLGWVAWLNAKLTTSMLGLGFPAAAVQARVGLAPLLANTVGKYLTGVPLEYDTSNSDLKMMWRGAHATLQARAGIPVEEQVTLKFVSHSGRRGGCTRARRVAQLAGIDPGQLKEYVYNHFRWSPEEGEMQELYTDHLPRSEALKITQFM
jgi:hypothetical protein